jgi:orotate phosphoribosyltransferase-like protein
VLPSIEALGANGLSRREIATKLQIATYKAESLLKECEIQHQRLRGGIKDEYEAIKSGYSRLFALLQDAEQIIEIPLQASEWNKVRAPEP